ncbi:MAG: glycosyltransferase [Opitutus sp.]|nr:glycosyltransferase [Opitutus sp.]
MTAASPHSARPRVLHYITRLGLGGAERVALDLVRGLKSDVDSAIFAVHGIAADAIGPALRRELAAAQTPLFCGTRLPLKWGGLLPAGWRAASAVQAFRPDLIHLHTEIPEASYAAMVTLQPSLKRIPAVRTIHNTVFWSDWPRLGRWCDRRMAHASIAGVSQGAGEAFARLRLASGAAAPPAPPAIIFNGVDVGQPPQSLNRVPGDPIRLLFAGRFEFQKGTDLLPSVLAAARGPANRRLELTLHGSGAHEPLLRALAAHPPTGWTVHVRPPVPELSRRMTEFDFVLMPSRFEGQSLVAIEAMLLAVPLVVTAAPGLCEQLPPDYPWRARVDDAADFARVLQSALAATTQCRATAAQALAWARERFDPRIMQAGYRRLYAQALEATRTPPA